MKQNQVRKLTHKQMENQVLLAKRKVQIKRRRAKQLGYTDDQLDQIRRDSEEAAACRIGHGDDAVQLGNETFKIIGSDEDSVTVMAIDA